MVNDDPFIDLKVPDIVKQKISTKYSSLATLSRAPAQELSEHIGISLKVAKSAISSARKLLKQTPITAMELLEEYKNKRKLTTGSQKLDEILAGGLSTGSITEIIGEYASGKSQLAFQLCVNAQLPIELGGLEGSIYFIDTEGTFSPKRVFEIAYAKKQQFPEIMDPEKILENIHVGRAYNAEHQITLVQDADKLIVEKNIKLLIIDSVAAHFRTEYVGKDSLPQRAQALMNHASLLYRYADSYNLVVVTTNQVLASVDKFLGGQGTEPALGFAWGHRPQTRMFLRKQKGSARIARIIDSPELPESEAVFHITINGIEDSFSLEEL
ncbi:MAG: DNA repair and recombination protein RadA [Candidatus Hodarchaeales archaeon]|jgi:DNA repair protein RadA